MNKRALALLVFTGSALCAEPGAVPPPKPPFVLNAPTCAAWTITYKPKSKAKPTPTPIAVGAAPVAPGGSRTLKEVQVSKVGKTRRVIEIWSDGSKSEKWWVDRYYIFQPPNNPQVYVVRLDRMGMLQSVLQIETTTDIDFPEMGWIEASMFVPPPEGKEQSYNLFREPTRTDADSKPPASPPAMLPPGASANLPASLPVIDFKKLEKQMQRLRKKGGRDYHPGMQAWIDAATKLPIALDDTVNMRVYSFDPNPPTSLELPSSFATALNNYKEVTVNAPARMQMKVN